MDPILSIKNKNKNENKDKNKKGCSKLHTPGNNIVFKKSICVFCIIHV